MPQTRSKHSPVSIAILSRAPVPGQTKTRLIPAIGAEGAADLHCRFLHATVRTAIADAEQRLGHQGRLIIRPSGTEPVIRVMGEGDDRILIEEVVDGIIDALNRVAA